ncbi:MAG TPA: peptide chain release factor N(5)-glutamine methyltransferase [Anaerovoracaceae bacterium]|nr:peptide chain release factor N(5)-glutamine methyltransferase [Anaerovoracaceae bacterium]
MSLPVKEILNIGQRQLAEAGVADAAIDTKLLYCYMMNMTESQFILAWQNALPDSLCEEFFKLLEIRTSGVPVQYIIGYQEFMGLKFEVNEKVLIPRQDTETMVEDAISIVNENKLRGEDFPIKPKKSWDVLDLCCGSGAIGISLAKFCPNARVTGSDVSNDALQVARENAKSLGMSSKVSFVSGDLLQPFKGKFSKKKFDMIISNPPYIESLVIPTLQREVKDHEPMMALDGGEDGLDFYKKIISDVAENLKKEGVLVLEIGYNQMEQVKALLENTFKFENITGLKDLAGRDRIVIATLAGKKK